MKKTVSTGFINFNVTVDMDCLDDLEKLMDLKNEKDGFTVQKT